MNDRDLSHVASLWHVARERRMTIGSVKRKLDAQLKAENGSAWASPLYRQQAEAARQLTEAKRRELAAIRALAKVCARQRGRLVAADVIDLDSTVTLLPTSD